MSTADRIYPVIPDPRRFPDVIARSPGLSAFPYVIPACHRHLKTGKEIKLDVYKEKNKLPGSKWALPCIGSIAYIILSLDGSNFVLLIAECAKKHVI